MKNAFLKNYTCEVPVTRTINRIEDVLIRCGVSGITKQYSGTNGMVDALVFHLEVPGQHEATIRLSPKADEAQDALYRAYMGSDLLPDGKVKFGSPKRKTKKSFREQAERTAWKLLQDRIEVEMSLIQLKQRDVVQAFMADVWDGRQTFYQMVKENGYRALLPEKTGTD